MKINLIVTGSCHVLSISLHANRTSHFTMPDEEQCEPVDDKCPVSQGRARSSPLVSLADTDIHATTMKRPV